MNRSTALLLAMAALLAHALAIHSIDARFAAPYDDAHVAYHLARNLVQRGVLAWNLTPLEGGVESHASPLLVLVAALAERLYLPVTQFCQTLGILAALATIRQSSLFATDRIAGFIPPTLLVASGGMAASAASGTEIPLLTLFTMGAFVALEHRWNKRLALSLALLVLTRPEGCVAAFAFGLFVLVERVARRRDGTAPMPLWTLAPAALVAAALFVLPRSDGASFYGSMLAGLVDADSTRLASGLAYVKDFVLSAATPLLLVFPLLLLPFGRLSGVGARALALVVVYAGVVILAGGGPIPFSLAMVPALPLVFIAVQQAVIAALDTKNVVIERLAWTLLGTGIAFSALASKFPGNLGPFETYEWHSDWLTASTPEPFGRDPYLGRLALQEELRATHDLRALATFLRRNVEPGSSLLAPWPGALGYLSRMRVLDLFGRTTRPPGAPKGSGWPPATEIDLLAVLQQEPDFILPGIVTRRDVADPDLRRRIAHKLFLLDQDSSVARAKEIDEALENYALITVPAGRGGGSFYLLRRTAPGYASRLALELSGRHLTVEVARSDEASETARRGPPQLAWLQVRAIDDRGRSWSLSPAGELSDEPRISARIGIVLDPDAERPTRLLDVELPSPPGSELVQLQAVLLNPGAKWGQEFARLCDEVELVLR